MRPLVGYDFDALPRVLAWPIREGLLARLAQVHDMTRDDVRHRQALWAAGVRGKKSKKEEMPQGPNWLRRTIE